MLADWYHVPSQLANAVPCINQSMYIIIGIVQLLPPMDPLSNCFPPKEL
jgi:hypothetical protein